ncbi:MAG: DMT family transporter [Betaproteobacteria bacterium]
MSIPDSSKIRALGRPGAFALLALVMLLWAGNWVLGRALRDAIDPLALNFWRWAIAALAIAPFALPQLAGAGPVIRRNAGLLVALSFTGVVLFQTLVYVGLRSTTTVNGVLLNSSQPLFILLCSWVLERERATLRQVAGMLISFAGIVVILARGDPATLLGLELRAGDAWILLAMPMWGIYSVLLKRLPPQLEGTGFLFVISVIGVAILAPFYAVDLLRAPPAWPSPAVAGAVLYVALAASVAGFTFWNRGVAVVGANAAGFTLHLLPAFGTVLAIALLGEAFRAYHAAGIVTIVAGVVLATTSGNRMAR